MDKNFGGVIWTNHALTRMRARGIKQGDAWATWRRPDQSRYAKSRGTWVYYRTFGSQKIEVVAKKTEKASGPKGQRPGGEWVILSVWSRPVRREKNKTRSKSKPFLSRLITAFKKTTGKARG